MQPLRTFVAIESSLGVQSAAARLIERLRAAPAKVRWVTPGNLHFTLKFLGDVSATDIRDVCQAVAGAVRQFEPFEAVVGGVGAFPNLDRPRTLWLGVREGVELFRALFAAVEAALVEMGYPPEGRHFSPHLTLGRVRESGSGMSELATLLGQYQNLDAGTIAVDEVTVFSSTLTRRGPEYEVLATLPLGGATN